MELESYATILPSFFRMEETTAAWSFFFFFFLNIYTLIFYLILKLDKNKKKLLQQLEQFILRNSHKSHFTDRCVKENDVRKKRRKKKKKNLRLIQIHVYLALYFPPGHSFTFT